MEIPASEIKVGDFIFDFGKVLKIKKFHLDTAQNQNVDFSINDDFITSVMKEVDACYNRNLNKICVESIGVSKTFFSDEMVSVYRLGKVA